MLGLEIEMLNPNIHMEYVREIIIIYNIIIYI